MAPDPETPISNTVGAMDISHHHRMKTTDVRNKFGWIIDTVAVQKSVVILHRRGRNLAAIIPMEEFLVWEKLVQKEEDRQDIEAADRAFKEDPIGIPLEQLRKELDLDETDSQAVAKRRKRAAAAAKGRSGARVRGVVTVGQSATAARHRKAERKAKPVPRSRR